MFNIDYFFRFLLHRGVLKLRSNETFGWECKCQIDEGANNLPFQKI